MTKLRRTPQPAHSDDASLRLRAAWLYHSYGLTQNEVADHLGIGRSTVIRLLDEARARGEVKIWIEDGGEPATELALKLERALKLDEVVVVPSAEQADAAARAVGLALGKFLSETVADDMTIGVGWGRTLLASLASFHPPKRSGIKVLSLLGGAVDTQFANPFEYGWRVATALNAACFLFPAPLVVDSSETRSRLMADPGITRLRNMADHLDLAVVSVGDISSTSGSLVRHLIDKQELQDLVRLGCVADIMCNFVDKDGALVPHPLNERVMSVGVGALRRAKHLVIAGGGITRAVPLLAVIRCVGCNTLFTDEAAARLMLDMIES
jgi:DNA-binding transcriptional regulator LsrR (DeoR family)